MRDFIE